MTHSELRSLARALIAAMRDEGLEHLADLADVLANEPIDDLTELGSVLDHYTALERVKRQAYTPAGTP